MPAAKVGWWRNSANAADKRYLCEYLRTNGDDIAWDLIRVSMSSVANTCVIMMQVR